jgi:hypothetical protein
VREGEGGGERGGEGGGVRVVAWRVVEDKERGRGEVAAAWCFKFSRLRARDVTEEVEEGRAFIGVRVHVSVWSSVGVLL